MQNYSVEQISSRLWRIVDALGVAMYLITGDERACLIDSGYGLTGLRKVVENITDMPVFVLLTHGHVDHAFGIYEFEDVYMNPLDTETYQLHSDAAYRERFMRNMTKDYDKLVFQPEREMVFQDVTDGQVFDLGNYHIEAVHVPGHTKGMMMYLLIEDRIMLFGDACGPNTMVMEDCSGFLKDYMNSLHKVKSFGDRYDRVLRNHGTFESSKVLLDNVTEVCEHILAGTDAKVLLDDMMQNMFPCKEPGKYKCYSAKVMVMDAHAPYPVDGKEGNIYYREDKINN